MMMNDHKEGFTTVAYHRPTSE